MTCRQAREELAVALLSRRPVRADLSAHLASCPDCAAEYAGLEVLPGLLEAARSTSAPAVQPVGPALLDRLLAQVRRRHRRRQTLAATAAASVVALSVLVSPWGSTVRSDLLPGGRAVPGTRSSTASAVLARGSADDPATGAWALVQVRQGAWGSDLEVQVSGLAPGRVCRMVVVDTAGRRIPAGSWTIPARDYPTRAGFHETVEPAAADLVRAEILDDGTGTTIVVVPLHSV